VLKKKMFLGGGEGSGGGVSLKEGYVILQIACVSLIPFAFGLNLGILVLPG
jgi:hypothetical protein